MPSQPWITTVLLYPFLPFSSEKICGWLQLSTEWKRQQVKAGYPIPGRRSGEQCGGCYLIVLKVTVNQLTVFRSIDNALLQCGVNF